VRVAEEETKHNDNIKVKVRHQIYMQQGPYIDFVVKT
jgi:hypothetical protein